MKLSCAASSILCLLSFFALAACDALNLPDISAIGAVPDDVKAQARVIETPQPNMPDASGWPRVGDVPFKPKDFSPPAATNHYINEMEFERADAQVVKKQVEDQAAVSGDTPPRSLTPPQLSKE